jgi:hypothetical protein
VRNKDTGNEIFGLIKANSVRKLGYSNQLISGLFATFLDFIKMGSEQEFGIKDKAKIFNGRR